MERILRDLVTENADLQSDLQTTDRQLAEKVKFASKKCGLYIHDSTKLSRKQI